MKEGKEEEGTRKKNRLCTRQRHAAPPSWRRCCPGRLGGWRRRGGVRSWMLGWIGVRGGIPRWRSRWRWMERVQVQVQVEVELEIKAGKETETETEAKVSSTSTNYNFVCADWSGYYEAEPPNCFISFLIYKSAVVEVKSIFPVLPVVDQYLYTYIHEQIL